MYRLINQVDVVIALARLFVRVRLEHCEQEEVFGWYILSTILDSVEGNGE